MALLRNGQKVPDFRLKDIDGGDFHLADNLGQGTILTWIRGEW